MVDSGRRGPYYLITGLLIGLVLGVFYGWVINPTRYIDISPQSLHEDQKKQYLLLIAESYQANEDIGRSYSRIKEMMDPVDADELRSMLLTMEIDPGFQDKFEVVRDFINALEPYMQLMSSPAPAANPNPVQAPINEPAIPAPAEDEQSPFGAPDSAPFGFGEPQGTQIAVTPNGFYISEN